MCQQPRPKMPKPMKQNKPGKPYIEEKKHKQEEDKTGVYYDQTDGSFNVPIAGIKKYDHKPGKNNVDLHYLQKKEAAMNNIVTLDSLKNKPEQKKDGSNIVTLDSLKNKPQEKVKKIEGKRDLLGLLQDAASDEPLPCMRKNNKKKDKK